MQALGKTLARLSAALVLGAAALLPHTGISYAATPHAPQASVHTTERDFSVLVPSCSGTTLLCTPAWTVTLPFPAPSLLSIEFLVPGSHCASLRLHLSLDAKTRATTRWLGWQGATGAFAKLPLATGRINLGLVAPGTHRLGLQAEAQNGGCVSGTLMSWAGLLKVFTTGSSPQAQPTASVKVGVQFLSATVVAGGQQGAQITTAASASVVVVVDYPNGAQTVLGPKPAGPDGHLGLIWTLPAGIHGMVHVTVDSAGRVAQGTFTVS